MSRWTSPDPYVVLGIEPGSSLADAKTAYRQLAKRLHPDANGGDPRAAAAFDAVNHAYNKLCDRHGRPRPGGPLLNSSEPLVATGPPELRVLGAGVEAQVSSTARLRPYNRQLPMLPAAAIDLRAGSITVLDPDIVELFRRSAFSDDEAGIKALVTNAAAAMKADRELFSRLRHSGMGGDALALLAEAIICEAAVQQHEGEMIIDGQFFSPVVQSRLAMLIRRTEIVVRQLLAHDCMKGDAPKRTTDSATPTQTSSGFTVLE